MGIAFDPTKQTLVDLAVAELAPQVPVPGHARGRVVEAFSADQLRGVPILGLGVGGAINGTRPGDSAGELDRAAREILRSSLHRNRFKPS
jgi:hypothetical protein